MNRMSIKCGKEEKVEKGKIAKALEKDNHDGARIHAQNAIRQKNLAQNYLRMSSRIDAVASRLGRIRRSATSSAWSGFRFRSTSTV